MNTLQFTRTTKLRLALSGCTQMDADNQAAGRIGVNNPEVTIR
jgi:hypothetical protein